MKKNEKVQFILLVFLSMVTAVSIDIYLPSMPDVARTFHTSAAHVALSLNMFMFCFALAQLIYGPFIDKFGRKKTLLFSLILYVSATFFCTMSESINQLIIARSFQAIGACGVSVVVYAAVRDSFVDNKAAKALSLISLSITLIPIIAPSVGGYLNHFFGWRSNFVLLFILGLLLCLFTVILFFESDNTKHNIINIKTFIRNYFKIVKDKKYLIYISCSSLSFAGFFSSISVAPFLFVTLAGVKSENLGFIIAINAIGLLFGNYLTGKLTNRMHLDSLIFIGSMIAFFGGFLMLLFASIFSVRPFFILIPMIISSFGATMVMPTSLAGALSAFSKNIGSVSALSGFLRVIIASLLADLVCFLTNTSAITLALSIMICTFICILILLMKNKLISKPYCIPEAYSSNEG